MAHIIQVIRTLDFTWIVDVEVLKRISVFVHYPAIISYKHQVLCLAVVYETFDPIKHVSIVERSVLQMVELWIVAHSRIEF